MRCRCCLAHLDANLCGLEKQQAAPTWKKTFGFHPLTVFADHGPGGSGESLAIMLRPGNAGSVRHEVAQVEWIHWEEAG